MTRPKGVSNSFGGKVRRSTSIVEFAKRAKLTLLREDSGHQMYGQWQGAIEDYKLAGLTDEQATVYASEDFMCLTRLLGEYDFGDVYAGVKLPKRKVIKKQPAPDASKRKPGDKSVTCEGRELSYRENLRWAMANTFSNLK